VATAGRRLPGGPGDRTGHDRRDPGRCGAPGRGDRHDPAGAGSRRRASPADQTRMPPAGRLPPARRRLLGEQRAARTNAPAGRGVVAHSSGNHAQAIAYAAALLGVPATVVVPDNAPEAKLGPTRRLGAQIVPCQPTLAARIAATEDLISRYGYTLIPPFDHRDVIAGQGTIGLEIAAQCPDVDLVAVPISGGGLISGIAAAIRATCPRARVIGVEPELAADARDSFRQRERVAWPASATQRTVADALRVAQIGAMPL